METRAILFIFEGNSIPEEYAISMSKNIGLVCNAERVHHFIFSSEDIANCILSGGAPNITGTSVYVDAKKKVLASRTPEDEAIIFIGTIMEEALKAPFNAQNFASQIIKKINEVKSDFVPDTHRQFMNALFILSQENLKVSSSLMKKYHFSQEKLHTIRKTYNFLTKI